MKRIALLHGAGYAGSELIRLLLAHPSAALVAVTSRTFAGKPVWVANPSLRGQTELHFSPDEGLDLSETDAVLITAEHGQGAHAVRRLFEARYDGAIVDLSADFRLTDPALYQRWFGFEHPMPEMLSTFVYGLPEVYGPYPADARYVANPGCFSTGINLALWPLARHLDGFSAAVTALTGASGSGTKPTPTTHFPTREGNVRAYKVFGHQHLPEVHRVLGAGADVHFVPASGPWTRGIWGTCQVTLPRGTDPADVQGWYESAYADAPFVRVWPGELPELRHSVNTPFCDVGIVQRGDRLVVGFGLDNLLKGAASQALQNLNRVLGLPETAGLLPDSSFHPSGITP